jgi:7-cyano-7-deazaguanine reductase
MTGYTRRHAQAGLRDRLPPLETFPSQFRGYEVVIVAPEFTSVCPKTGQPDFGTITIRYGPAARCVELKSLKMYLQGYRNLGIFQENAVNRILRDFVRAVRPVWCEVRGEFAPRGGIRTEIVARHGRIPATR